MRKIVTVGLLGLVGLYGNGDLMSTSSRLNTVHCEQMNQGCHYLVKKIVGISDISRFLRLFEVIRMINVSVRAIRARLYCMN